MLNRVFLEERGLVGRLTIGFLKKMGKPQAKIQGWSVFTSCFTSLSALQIL